MLDSLVRDEIRIFVRSGFYSKQALLKIFTQELYKLGDLDLTELSAFIDTEFEEFEIEKNSWPSITDCDLLDEAFIGLNSKGVIALQNAGYTQSDGYDDVKQCFNDHPSKNSVTGYCFFQAQDLERAVRGKGLYLAFGPINPELEDTEGPKIGKVIRKEMESRGLKVEWDGSFDSRILLPDINWQKR